MKGPFESTGYRVVEKSGMIGALDVTHRCTADSIELAAKIADLLNKDCQRNEYSTMEKGETAQA